MICDYVGTLTAYVIIEMSTLHSGVLEIIAFMLNPYLSILQVILICTKYINDTSKELAEDNDYETMMIELTKLYNNAELRIQEYESVKDRAINHKYTKPSYAALFTKEYLKRTIEAFSMLTLRGLCGFAVTRLFLSAIFKETLIDILCISLIIAGAIAGFFLFNSKFLE
jgi:hypothetical protein